MRRLVGVVVLLALSVALPAVEVHAQKKDKNQQAAPTLDSSKAPAGEFVGTLKSTPNTDRTFILTHEFQKLVQTDKNATRNANTAASRVMQIQNQIAADQQHAANARNRQQQQQAMRSLNTHYTNLQREMAKLNGQGNGGIPPGYKVQTAKEDIEFQSTDAVKVRTMVLPETFDEKGNVKKYSKEELTELKGKDKKAVGYESSLDKLENGQKVRITLRAHKPAAKEKDKEADKDADKDEKKMQVTQIVILAEAPPSTAPNKGGKKKNK